MNNNDAPTPPSDPAGLSRWPQSSHNDPETPQAQAHDSSSRMPRLKKPPANKALGTTQFSLLVYPMMGVCFYSSVLPFSPRASISCCLLCCVPDSRRFFVIGCFSHIISSLLS